MNQPNEEWCWCWMNYCVGLGVGDWGVYSSNAPVRGRVGRRGEDKRGKATQLRFCLPFCSGGGWRGKSTVPPRSGQVRPNRFRTSDTLPVLTLATRLDEDALDEWIVGEVHTRWIDPWQRDSSFSFSTFFLCWREANESLFFWAKQIVTQPNRSAGVGLVKPYARQEIWIWNIKVLTSTNNCGVTYSYTYFIRRNRVPNARISDFSTESQIRGLFSATPFPTMYRIQWNVWIPSVLTMVSASGKPPTPFCLLLWRFWSIAIQLALEARELTYPLAVGYLHYVHSDWLAELVLAKLNDSSVSSLRQCCLFKVDGVLMWQFKVTQYSTGRAKKAKSVNFETIQEPWVNGLRTDIWVSEFSDPDSDWFTFEIQDLMKIRKAYGVFTTRA